MSDYYVEVVGIVFIVIDGVGVEYFLLYVFVGEC